SIASHRISIASRRISIASHRISIASHRTSIASGLDCVVQRRLRVVVRRWGLIEGRCSHWCCWYSHVRVFTLLNKPLNVHIERLVEDTIFRKLWRGQSPGGLEAYTPDGLRRVWLLS
ncbi:MAG: hypothetical protein JXB30_00295, partial [Anaerolineae bacterium]|nr:hypothetical protein [Anaerolineae bacterium]